MRTREMPAEGPTSKVKVPLTTQSLSVLVFTDHGTSPTHLEDVTWGSLGVLDPHLCALAMARWAYVEVAILKISTAYCILVPSPH